MLISRFWDQGDKTKQAMSATEIFIGGEECFFPGPLIEAAAAALDAAKKKNCRIVLTETVTSGLVSACLTSVSGASQIFERGYILYHESAKASGLGLLPEVAAKYGAVSREVTVGLAEGALANSGAGVAVAVTGYAGPGGGSAANPVGTIFLAAASHGSETRTERYVFSGSRDNVRLNAVLAALRLLVRQIEA
jgi:nicotinamide-nucleotide amidase